MQLGEGLQLRIIWRKNPRIILSVYSNASGSAHQPPFQPSQEANYSFTFSIMWVSSLYQRHQFADKGPHSQSYDFSSSHVQIWELDHKEGWALKNWCFQTVVLEKILETPRSNRSNQSILKEINPEYHWMDWLWSWNSYTLASWYKELTHWERPWC